MVEVALRDGPSGPLAGAASVIRSTLADLVARDSASFQSGTRAWVQSERKFYQLDTSAPLTPFSPLIIARPGQSAVVNGAVAAPSARSGAWYRESRAFVVANYTLWVAGFNSKNYALGYTPGQLLASGVVQADIVLTSIDNSNSSICCVVDGNGNLWWNIEGGANRAVQKIALLDTLQSGTPVPVVKLDPANTSTCHAFDKWNSLWVSIGAAAYKKYTAAQYGNSGAPTPQINVQPQLVTGAESFIFFDDANNLWSSSFSMSSISMLADSQLRTSSVLTERPTVVWSGANVAGTGGIAMGPTGLLWAAQYVGGAGTVKAYDPTNPSSSNPAVVINLTSTSFVGVWDVAFDRAGNLWVLNFDNGHLLRIPAASLAASGAVVPDVDVTITTPTGALSSPEGMNFSQNPNRSGLLVSGGPPV